MGKKSRLRPESASVHTAKLISSSGIKKIKYRWVCTFYRTTYNHWQWKWYPLWDGGKRAMMIWSTWNVEIMTRQKWFCSFSSIANSAGQAPRLNSRELHTQTAKYLRSLIPHTTGDAAEKVASIHSHDILRVPRSETAKRNPGFVARVIFQEIGHEEPSPNGGPVRFSATADISDVYAERRYELDCIWTVGAATSDAVTLPGFFTECLIFAVRIVIWDRIELRKEEIRRGSGKP